ncbi:MAG: transcription antitermination factor NusB [Verrucomicrobiales bacterium]|nr:transcription antitermination factor NusB [Verrucomicrobiales bacterium]
MDSPSPRDLKPKKKAPSPRRDGREAAVQFLYGNEAQGSVEVTLDRLSAFWELRDAKPIVREFAEELIHGVTGHLDEIDATIRTHLENYTLQRLTAVDRSILRLGAYEVIFSNHIPPQAAINEAIEVAKRFGTEDSPGFVNGILDRILKR